MRTYKFPYEKYDEPKKEAQLLRTQSLIEAQFNALHTDEERYAMLALDYRVAYVWKTPSKKAIKDLGFRYRECFRVLRGDAPEHIVDVIIKSDPAYIGWLDKLTSAQQLHVLKTDPFQIYRFPNLFEDRVINKKNAATRNLIETIGQLGIVGNDFNTQIKTAFSKTILADKPLSLPDHIGATY